MNTGAKQQIDTHETHETNGIARSGGRNRPLTGSPLLALCALVGPLWGCAVAADATGEDLGAARSDVSLPGGGVALPFPKPFPRPPRLDPEEFLEITAGIAHTCARKRNGIVYCWGRDDLGQAGGLPTANCASSPNQCVDRPTQVYSFGGFTTATQIDAGDRHTCALDPAGQAYCWGSASHGQLGVGVFGSISEPVLVSGGLTFSSISGGTFTTCGTTAAGLYCWGNPIAGTWGWNNSNPNPLLIYSATGLAPTGVSVGYAHVCAQWVMGAYRETNCWGRNWEGQTGSAFSPTTVLGQGPGGVGTAALRVASESTFTCVDQPGPSVQCFGAGTNGQLGNGMNTNAATPQQVGGLTLLGFPPMALRGVSTGDFHACALDPNGAAYCWGNGNYGQLGNGLPAPGATSGTSSSWPVPVVGGLTYKAIAAGQRHTCAIGTDNHIYCWGSNYHGELGTQYKSPNQPYTNGWVASPVQARDP